MHREKSEASFVHDPVHKIKCQRGNRPAAYGSLQPYAIINSGVTNIPLPLPLPSAGHTRKAADEHPATLKWNTTQGL